LLLISISLIEENAIAQKVIDNEILSTDHDNNGETDSKGNSEGEETSNINEFAAKPLVHVSIEGTEINDKIRGGDGNDLMSGEDGKDTLQGHEGDDEIDGGKGEDNIDGGEGDDGLNGGDDNDDIIGGVGDDEIDGGHGSDVVNGGDGKDKLKGGADADRFICDQDDKISDYNSLENDLIIGECEYEDKGLIPKPSLEKNPIPTDYVAPNREDNNNLKSIDSRDSEEPNSEDNNNLKSIDSRDSEEPNSEDNFKKFMSKFIDTDVPQILR